MNGSSNLCFALEDGAFLPKRAHNLDAGLDLMTPIDFDVPAHGFRFVDTGVHVELPDGTDGHIRSKSGLNRYYGLTVDGTVDEGYSGTIGVTIHNHSDQKVYFTRGEKIAQLVIEPILRPTVVLRDRVQSGPRGEGGYGSTGA